MSESELLHCPKHQHLTYMGVLKAIYRTYLSENKRHIGSDFSPLFEEGFVAEKLTLFNEETLWLSH